MGPTIGIIAVGYWLAIASPWGSEASQQLAKKAFDAQQKRDYASSLRLYQQGYNESLAAGDRLVALRFIQGVGGSQLGLYRFRDALASFLEARRLALELNSVTDLGAASVNLASLYLQINDVAATRQTAQQALDNLKKSPLGYYRIQLYYILAAVAVRQDQPESAFAYLRQGINEADTPADLPDKDHLVIVGLDRLARALLDAGRLDAAEHASLEVFRYRFLNKDPNLVFSYLLLAEIAMRRGHLDEAKRLSQRGIDRASKDPRGLPLHDFQKIHAQILERRGEYAQAHAAFLATLSSARRWRLDLLPADAFRTSGESSFALLYDEALQNAAHLYFDQHQNVAAEAWIEAEDWGAASLRHVLAGNQEWLVRVGPEYWEVLAKYRRLDASSLRNPTKEGLHDLERLQVRLAEMESFAGVQPLIEPHNENFSSRKALTPYRRSLRKAQTLISFQLGESVSHRWILGSSGLTWTRLPPRAEIAQLSGRFRDAVQSGSGSARSLGLQLGNLLFGNLNGDAEQARSWVLVLDDVLFQIPLAALLRSDRKGVDRYLIEQCSLTALPGAWSLLGKPVGEWKGGFVGVADAVYNSADPRWAIFASNRSSRPASAAVSLRLAGQSVTKAQLPRLPASQDEVHAAARAWNPNDRSVMLIGMDANLRDLSTALARRPSIVHFAAHVLPNPKALDRAYIALSLAPDGSPELLSTSDVAHLKLNESLVVLSGCHSQVGSAVPGSGLIGLVRAWLMSGAAAVIASLWPTTDDRGVIFESFYRELRKETRLPGQSPVQSAAEALRRAQLEMLRTNSWRAQPKYWATYLITGRTG